MGLLKYTAFRNDIFQGKQFVCRCIGMHFMDQSQLIFNLFKHPITWAIKYLVGSHLEAIEEKNYEDQLPTDILKKIKVNRYLNLLLLCLSKLC